MWKIRKWFHIQTTEPVSVNTTAAHRHFRESLSDQRWVKKKKKEATLGYLSATTMSNFCIKMGIIFRKPYLEILALIMTTQ